MNIHSPGGIESPEVRPEGHGLPPNSPERFARAIGTSTPIAGLSAFPDGTFRLPAGALASSFGAFVPGFCAREGSGGATLNVPGAFRLPFRTFGDICGTPGEPSGAFAWRFEAFAPQSE
jgi:hypothetical protein